jgi:condensin complex subunit 2
VPKPDALYNLNISDALSSFRFSSDPNSMPDFSTLIGLKDSWDDDAPSTTYDDGMDGSGAPAGGDEHDFFGGEDFDAAGGGGGDAGGFDDAMSMAGDDDNDNDNGDFAGPSHSAPNNYSGGALGMGSNGEKYAPFDPRRQGGELVMALAGGAGDDGEGMFDYFDKGLGKAWAGAEHWKLRKVTKKGEFMRSIMEATQIGFSVNS